MRDDDETFTVNYMKLKDYTLDAEKNETRNNESIEICKDANKNAFYGDSAPLVLVEQKEAATLECLLHQSTSHLRAIQNLGKCDVKCLEAARAVSTTIANDIETQIYYLRLGCRKLLNHRAPVKIALALIRVAGAFASLIFYLFSSSIPAQGLRMILGGLCKNTLQLCVLSEVLLSIRNTVAYVKNGSSNNDRTFVTNTAERLVGILLGLATSRFIPAPYLAGHLVACVSLSILDATLSACTGQSDFILSCVFNVVSEAYARIRLSSFAKDNMHLTEECDDETDWMLSDMQIN